MGIHTWNRSQLFDYLSTFVTLQWQGQSRRIISNVWTNRWQCVTAVTRGFYAWLVYSPSSTGNTSTIWTGCITPRLTSTLKITVLASNQTVGCRITMTRCATGIPGRILEGQRDLHRWQFDSSLASFTEVALQLVPCLWRHSVLLQGTLRTLLYALLSVLNHGSICRERDLLGLKDALNEVGGWMLDVHRLNWNSGSRSENKLPVWNHKYISSKGFGLTDFIFQNLQLKPI